MYAVIVCGGKQYKVKKGDVIEVEKITGDEKSGKIELDVLMTVDGDKMDTSPAKKAVAEVVSQGKGKKIVVYKYKAKKNSRRKMGHRQPFTKIKIVSIA